VNGASVRAMRQHAASRDTMETLTS
jgi:hypothetical protein